MRKHLEDIFYGVSILLILLGGILWLSNMNSMATSSAQDIKDLKVQEADHNKQFEEIRLRLAHIEDAVVEK